MTGGHPGKYEVLVSADTAEEAIEIAAEALPRGAEVTKSEARLEKAHTWQVKLAFRGGRRASSDQLE